MNSLIQFRVDENIKNEANEVYENLGLDLSSAIKIFLKKSIKLQRLPFSLNDDDISTVVDDKDDKAMLIKELDDMRLNISNDNVNADIYEGIMEKYESIN